MKRVRKVPEVWKCWDCGCELEDDLCGLICPDCGMKYALCYEKDGSVSLIVENYIQEMNELEDD